jgi:hypothetical protein
MSAHVYSCISLSFRAIFVMFHVLRITSADVGNIAFAYLLYVSDVIVTVLKHLINHIEIVNIIIVVN